ncbi:hypothetical protein BDY24DRAFT_435681 [Mrakia frigida]|uniref:uncharacterized protein n=1 Tax=Mrakia frigida TaxID=29902 RepID=UPI003FCBF16A
MSSSSVATPEVTTKITKTSLFAKSESTGNLESLLLWLNNQGDILTSLLVHFAGVKEEAELVQIKEMDDHGFDLIYCLLSSDEGVMSESRVNFDVPLKRWKEARPKMLAMRDEAAKALAINENPNLPPFTNPPMWPEQALIITLLVIQFLTFVLPESSTLPLSVFSDIRAVVGVPFIKFSYFLLVVAHVSEAVWFWNKLSNQGVKGGDLRKWVYWTLAFGLVVSGSHYKRQIQVARIRDIYAKVAPTPVSKSTSTAKVGKGRVGEGKKKQ